MQWYDHCLGSLCDSEMPIETIVIDNASTDGTVAYIKEHFPDTIIIESKENLGFAKANNIGIRYSLDHGADYVFLLNQDAWIEPNTIKILLDTFKQDEKIGIVSPIHLNGNKSGLDYMFAGYISREMFFDLYKNKIKPTYELEFVNAAAWMLKVQCISNIGGFDTLLFKHYGEDRNYCQRVIYHGFKILLNTQCTICHDRQDRKLDNENTYRNQIFSQEYIDQKIHLGNINCAVNINTQIRMYYLYMLKSVLCVNIKKLKKQIKEIKLLRQIEQSRQINKTIGTHWL